MGPYTGKNRLLVCVGGRIFVSPGCLRVCTPPGEEALLYFGLAKDTHDIIFDI